MNYTLLYSNLISTRQLILRSKIEGIFERHHIVPRSIGGTNDSANLVLLTPREHYMAHWLLYKIHAGKNKAKMAYAFFKMTQRNPAQHRVVNSRQYDAAKRAISMSCTGINHPGYGVNPFTEDQLLNKRLTMQGANNPMFGQTPWNKGLTKDSSPAILASSIKHMQAFQHRIHPSSGQPRSDEVKQKIRAALTGQQKSDSHKTALSMANLGKKLSHDTRAKMSASRKGQLQETGTCPNCGKQGKLPAMYRWHFAKCKTLS